MVVPPRDLRWSCKAVVRLLFSIMYAIVLDGGFDGRGPGELAVSAQSKEILESVRPSHTCMPSYGWTREWSIWFQAPMSAERCFVTIHGRRSRKLARNRERFTFQVLYRCWSEGAAAVRVRRRYLVLKLALGKILALYKSNSETGRYGRGAWQTVLAIAEGWGFVSHAVLPAN